MEDISDQRAGGMTRRLPLLPGCTDVIVEYGVNDFVIPSRAQSTTPCRVYWGSHGCDFERGHDGPHECYCCECPDHAANPFDEDGVECVAKSPYYGPETNFYGEDVPSVTP